MKPFLSVLLLSLAGMHSAWAAEAIRTERFTLKNGLEVVVVPNHRVPAVSHTLWYKVGSADDPQGKSGLSHYLEHMMFLGTQRFPKDSYTTRIAALGGENNAFTSYDFTGYYVNIAKDKLPQVMELEADRMRHLAPPDKEFPREREVIIEERRMTLDNKPAAILGEQMDAALYRNHPYGKAIIGWQHEMAGLTKDDVMTHYRKFYAPANAVLVVAGDITAQELKPLAEKYYGLLNAGKPAIRHWQEEPPQNAARTVTLHHANVTQPVWYKTYSVESLSSKDNSAAFPLYVLAQVLAGGETSRLYQSLVVQQKLATSVDADYSGIRRGMGEFSLSAVPAEEVSVQALETAIHKEITSFITNGVSDGEFTRAKTLLKAESVYSRDSLSDVANVVGQLRSIGLDMAYYTEWENRIEAVTAAQVTTVAKAAFDDKASVTGYLLPEEK